MTETRFEGVAIRLGEREFIVPPLSFNQLKRLWPEIEKLQQGTSPMDLMTATVQLAHTALSRNYSDLSIEDLGDLVDLGNMKALIDAVMGASGFLGKGAARTEAAPTGTSSLPTS